MTDKWEKIKQLTLWELWFLTKAALLLPLTTLGLQLFGYKTVQAVLNYRLPVNSTSSDSEALSKAQRIAKMIRIAAAHGPFGATCLPQSMVLSRFLQRQGIGCDLRLGARAENGDFEAHAWVEVDGVPVNDTEDVRERFRPLGKEAPE